jgi:hypothetical protein
VHYVNTSKWRFSNASIPRRSRDALCYRVVAVDVGELFFLEMTLKSLHQTKNGVLCFRESRDRDPTEKMKFKKLVWTTISIVQTSAIWDQRHPDFSYTPRANRSSDSSKQPNKDQNNNYC